MIGSGGQGGAGTGSAIAGADDRPGTTNGAPSTGAPVDAAATPDAVGTGDDAAAARRPATLLVVGGLTAVVALPLILALVALRSPRWYPVLDLAMTELRVRDVGTSHTPLIGLVGRLSSNGNQGSHPGPISFWALAPVYRLLGGSAWSLLVGVVVLNTTAIGLTLWVAVRRGGARLALGFGAAIAVLVHLYGTRVLTEPWNPYLPVMWWPLTLVAVWAVLCDDLAMLPVAVFAASFCMQTHISYLGLVGGFAALGVVGLAVRAYTLRGDRPALRRLARWSAVALALGFVLWLPPLIDQVTRDPGNASIVIDHFRQPDEDPIGLSRGAELLGAHLNPWRLLTGDPANSGSVLPGLALVAAWLAAAVVTWRLPAPATAGVAGADGARAAPPRALVRLHVVIALALVLGLVSSSRILGYVWFYLTLWAWTVTMLIVVAIGWTVVIVPGPSRSPWRRSAPRAGVGALAAVLAVWTTLFAIDAVDAEPTDARESAMVGELADVVSSAIDAGEVVGGGPDGAYLLTWTDGIHIGAPGFGMLAELERRGYDVGVLAAYAPGAVESRVLEIADATAEVHISFGPDIPVWDDMPGAERLAYVDPRTDDERARYEHARNEAIDAIERAGREELVPLVDKAPFMLYFDDRLPADARQPISVITEIGQPAAVFVGPVSLSP